MTTRADPTPREQRYAMSLAIRAMREQAGANGRKLSTAKAAEAIGLTRQTWEKYENDKADVVLRQDVQTAIAQALGITRQDLLAEYERRLGVPVGERRPASSLNDNSAAFNDFPPASTRRLLLQDDLLRPWASSGTMVVYDLEQWPRRDEGCVIETEDGRRLVKIFLRADDENFHVAELSPPREFTVPREGAAAFRVMARLG